jgi:hypothetical protein
VESDVEKHEQNSLLSALISEKTRANSQEMSMYKGSLSPRLSIITDAGNGVRSLANIVENKGKNS